MKNTFVSLPILFIIVPIALAQSPTTDRGLNKTISISSAKEIINIYTKDMKAHPLPEKLKAGVISPGFPFHLKAAVAKAQGPSSVEITVVTEEAQLPENAECLFLCLMEGANAKNVCELIGKLGSDGLLSGMSSSGIFIQGLLSRKNTKTPENVTIFEGVLKGSMDTVATDKMDFDGYISIQLCSHKAPSPYKSTSNAIWVRIAK
jgi:hypothetical protein